MVGSLVAQQYPYVYLKGKSIEDFSSDYGYYYMKDNVFENQPLDIGFQLWGDNIIKQIESLPREKQNVLFYIHGLWADNEDFFKLALLKMDKDVYAKDSNPFGCVVSFKWDSGVIYDKNQKMAVQKGQIFVDMYGQLMAKIKNKFPDIKVAFLCHSMGNKVFESMVNTSVENDKPLGISTLIMAAPDVDESVFGIGGAMVPICNSIPYVKVYHHPGDKTLAISGQLNKVKRIGQVKTPIVCDECQKVVFHNVEDIKDGEDFASRVGNHRYFYSSPIIRADILATLMGQR